MIRYSLWAWRDRDVTLSRERAWVHKDHPAFSRCQLGEDNALNRVLPDGTLSDLMADTQAAIEVAYTLAMNAVGEMAASVLEPFPVLGDDQIPQYTNRLEFTAAVSSAEDRRFLSLLIHADALMIRAEGLYLAGLIDAEILGDVSVNMDAILETCATEVTRVIHQMAIAFTRRNRHERLF